MPQVNNVKVEVLADDCIITARELFTGTECTTEIPPDFHNLNDGAKQYYIFTLLEQLQEKVKRTISEIEAKKKPWLN